MLNVSIISGRLTADPDLKQTPNGVSVVSFTVAVSRSFVKQGEERQADFIPVIAWSKSAEFVSKFFTKGSLIEVVGEIQTRNFEDKNGNKRKSVEVLANKISFGGDKKSGDTAQPSISGDFEVIDDGESELPF